MIMSGEEEVYATLGLPYIPPVLREDRGEIEAALMLMVRHLAIRRGLPSHPFEGGRALWRAFRDAFWALINQPKILLLDEPTFGVDPISRRDLWLIVHDMVAQGVTVVVSTAYMDEADRNKRAKIGRASCSCWRSNRRRRCRMRWAVRCWWCRWSLHVPRAICCDGTRA